MLLLPTSVARAKKKTTLICEKTQNASVAPSSFLSLSTIFFPLLHTVTPVVRTEKIDQELYLSETSFKRTGFRFGFFRDEADDGVNNERRRATKFDTTLTFRIPSLTFLSICEVAFRAFR